MKRVENGIVFSNDILRIMKGQNALGFNYNANGLIIPSEAQIAHVRNDFQKDVNRFFDGKVTIFSEEEMEKFLYGSLQDCKEDTIVSLDEIYYKGGPNSYFIDCTRLDGSKKLVTRKNPTDTQSLERQVRNISDEVKRQGKRGVILADDVVFSGNVLRTLTEEFNKNGTEILGVRASISTEDSYEFFNRNLEKGLKCGCVLGKDVIDQVCERDFYFGIAQSGISILESDGQISKAPYFRPFGNPVERASIPEEYESVFSNGCILRSMYIWKCIEKNSNRKIFIKDMPEHILGTSDDERVIDVLRKGLMMGDGNEERRKEGNQNEEAPNRSDGECR